VIDNFLQLHNKRRFDCEKNILADLYHICFRKFLGVYSIDISLENLESACIILSLHEQCRALCVKFEPLCFSNLPVGRNSANIFEVALHDVELIFLLAHFRKFE